MGVFFEDHSLYKQSVTAIGNTTTSTQSQWNNSSIYFDGSLDSLSIPTSSYFGFGADNFTIEFWSFRTSIINTKGIFDLGSYSNGILFRTASPVNADPFYIAGTKYNWDIDTYFPINTWTFFQIIRNGNNFQIYVNGVSRLSVTNTSNLGSSQPLKIGGSAHTTGQDYQGCIEDLRITKGIARPIEVPTQSFDIETDPYRGNVVLLLKGNTINFNNFNGVIPNGALSLSRASVTPSASGIIVDNPILKSHLHGGKGVVSGSTVKVPSDIPVARKVRLFEEKSGLLIQEVWSDAAGNYSFVGLSDNYYFITAHDHTLEFNGVIQSHVRPEFPV